MLILTRNIGQKVYINEKEIIVTILDVQGKQVRLGIQAPDHIDIHREEIYDKIKSSSNI